MFCCFIYCFFRMNFFVVLYLWCFFFFLKQKTAYEMRISDWSSDVCSSDLRNQAPGSLDEHRRHHPCPRRRNPYNPHPPRIPVAPAGAFAMPDVAAEAARRRTFAIISHPDAGKTTLTEKLLLFGGAIQMAGSVKSRKTSRHATSAWMALEQERGISVTSSVMQFPYEGRIVNLLDTPAHPDFGEDTSRLLTTAAPALLATAGPK